MSTLAGEAFHRNELTGTNSLEHIAGDVSPPYGAQGNGTLHTLFIQLFLQLIFTSACCARHCARHRDTAGSRTDAASTLVALTLDGGRLT